METLKRVQIRACQSVDEAFGLQKTELHAETQRAINIVEEIRSGSERLLISFRRHMQLDAFPELLQSINIETVNTSEEVARDTYKVASNLARHNVKSVETLLNLATAYEEIGTALRGYHMALHECLAPLRTILVDDLHAFDIARKRLNDMRLDLDAAKNTPKVDAMLVARLEVAFNQQQDSVRSAAANVQCKFEREYMEHLCTFAAAEKQHHEQCAAKLKAAVKV